MKKRILAVIMAVCVSMTALPADVRAAEDSAVQTESTQKTSPSEKSAQTENTGNAAEELTTPMYPAGVFSPKRSASVSQRCPLVTTTM